VGIAFRRMAMGERCRQFDHDFREGAVRLVRETGKPPAQVARDLGISDDTLGNSVNGDKRRRGEGRDALDKDEWAELRVPQVPEHDRLGGPVGDGRDTEHPGARCRAVSVSPPPTPAEESTSPRTI
jgi:transposase